MTDKEESTTRFVPDWETECDTCGQAPTVKCEQDGVVVYDTDLCGPCTWGQADMLDPEKWNEL